MKLLLRRNQAAAMIGSPTFTLDVRAEISQEERTAIDKYRLGKTVLYERDKIVDPGSGLLGLASRMAFRMMNISVSVNDLMGGKRINCKDIVEMLAVEQQLKEAAQTFKDVLHAALNFGGDEVVAL